LQYLSAKSCRAVSIYSRLAPYQHTVVGGHRNILQQIHLLGVRQRIDPFEVANTAQGIIAFQALVKGGITRTGKFTTVVERAIDDQQGTLRQHISGTAEKLFDTICTHKVQGIGAEQNIAVRQRPLGHTYIEYQCWRNIGWRFQI
jgi:hypothetical protein